MMEQKHYKRYFNGCVGFFKITSEHDIDITSACLYLEDLVVERRTTFSTDDKEVLLTDIFDIAKTHPAVSANWCIEFDSAHPVDFDYTYSFDLVWEDKGFTRAITLGHPTDSKSNFKTLAISVPRRQLLTYKPESSS